MLPLVDVRVRKKIPTQELEQKVGKIVGPEDFNLVLTGPTVVRMPNNQPLCVYLPGVLTEAADAEGIYDILHSLRTITTNNRGPASGTARFQGKLTKRSYSLPTRSTIVGAIDPMGQKVNCRLTAWTGRNLPQWEALVPFLQEIAENLKTYVPDRAAVQQQQADLCDPAWVVPGTPFTTITVNNTFPTGVHTDKGDLGEGFSTLACLRRGEYTGGQLVFPEFRVAVDMQHGDLLLLDAHQWHGNTAITCACGETQRNICTTCGAERISVVSYFRTKIVNCGTPEEELRKAVGTR